MVGFRGGCDGSELHFSRPCLELEDRTSPVSHRALFHGSRTRNRDLCGDWISEYVFLGGEFLDYAHLATVLPVSQEMARYHAMLGVEVGVGFTVTAIIFALYASLSSDGRMRDGL